ncbi:Clp protease N-terminal domain-containing protein [Longispora sp. NPDC051575]|uniref:Clp protease N-terminal domain-containing protein n=1 Tax=Longispora sp. NPDC051575 TaxID=3154943 RepID=UPI00342BD7C0
MVRLGEEAFGALRRAYLRAMREPLVTVGTDLVLLELRGRPVLGGVGREVAAPGPLPEPAGWATDPELHEAAWSVYRDMVRAEDSPWPIDGHRRPVWSAELVEAVAVARAVAAEHGVDHANERHLVLGLLTDTGSRACRLLASAGVDRAGLLARIRDDSRGTRAGEPRREVHDRFRAAGLLLSTHPRWWNGVQPAVTRTVARQAGLSAVLYSLEGEMLRQAGRTDSAVVMTDHAILAILALDEQLAEVGTGFGERVWSLNRAGEVLEPAGVTLDAATPVAGRGTTGQLTVPDAESSRLRESWRPGDPPWGRAVVRAMERAQEDAERRGHRAAGTTHLLLALVTPEVGTAAELLRNLGVDLSAVAAHAERLLGEVPAGRR